jgi:GNAT superfamily N-acetyltransferase
MALYYYGMRYIRKILKINGAIKGAREGVMKIAYDIQLIEPLIAEKICREITSTLPEWFGIPEANKRYAQGMLERTSFAASINGDDVGLLTLEFPFSNNANVYWMAVKKDHHGKKIGASLIDAAEIYCRNHGYTSLTVETLSPKENDKKYLKTYHFYEEIGFKPIFEMHTYGPDHLMVYMQKDLSKNIIRKIAPTTLELLPLEENDIDEIVTAFKNIGWNKPKSLYKKYLTEQVQSLRSVILAKIDGKFVGYVTLKCKSEYQSFSVNNIPEIVDLNVLPDFRERGVGTALIQACEIMVKDLGCVEIGLGVGLTTDYGNAQKLYVSLGYIPDGCGLHYKNKILSYSESTTVDDDLVLYFKKKL